MQRILMFLFGIHYDISTTFDFPRPCLLCGGAGQQIIISVYLRLLGKIMTIAVINFHPTHMWEWQLHAIGKQAGKEITKSTQNIREQIEILQGFEREMKEKWEKKGEKI